MPLFLFSVLSQGSLDCASAALDGYSGERRKPLNQDAGTIAQQRSDAKEECSK